MSHTLPFEPARILFIIDNLQFGGGERVFSQIINGLNSDQYHIFLVSSSNERFLSAIHNPQVRYYPLDFSKRFNPVSIFKIAKIIRNNQIQIVHGQGARAEFHARIAKRIAGNSFYVSTIAMPVEGFDVKYLRKQIYRIFDRFSERFVDKFIIVSDALRNMIINERDIPSGKVVRIYNGIEIDHYSPNEQKKYRINIRKNFNLDDNVILIGAVGRLVWQKGFEYLIESVPSIIQSIPNSKILIVGNGPLKVKLNDLSERLKVKENIIFTGFRNDIKEILDAIDILVIPSLLEGSPMIILEGMAMAKPIIATKIDGITEQIENNETGRLVPPRNSAALAEAIIEIIDNKELAEKIGLNARHRAESKFSVKKMVAETEKIYRSFLKN